MKNFKHFVVSLCVCAILVSSSSFVFAAEYSNVVMKNEKSAIVPYATSNGFIWPNTTSFSLTETANQFYYTASNNGTYGAATLRFRNTATGTTYMLTVNADNVIHNWQNLPQSMPSGNYTFTIDNTLPAKNVTRILMNFRK